MGNDEEKTEHDFEKKDGYVTCTGIDLGGTLKKIKKAKEQLRPIYEAVANALDSIESKYSSERNDNSEREDDSITITFSFHPQLDEGTPRSLELIKVEDTGSGITKDDFRRITRLNDCSKSPLNKGSGRLQFAKFFEETVFESVFKDDRFESGKARRKCCLSATERYLSENALIRNTAPTEAEPDAREGTVVTFFQPLNRKDRSYYEQITCDELKEKFISHFFIRLSQIENIPTINFVFKSGGKVIEATHITPADVPKPKRETFTVPYRQAVLTERETIRWKQTERSETFELFVFLLPENTLHKN